MDICQLQVLRTDVSGMPLEWLGYQEAAKLLPQVQLAGGGLGGADLVREGVQRLIDRVFARQREAQMCGQTCDARVQRFKVLL